MASSIRSEEATWGLLGCLDPGDAVVEVILHKTRFAVGRRADSDLRLNSAHVSSRHAEFINGDHVLFVRDLDSEHGTFINGDRLHGISPVDDGDCVQFADEEFVVQLNVPPQRADRDMEFGTVELFDAEPCWVFSQFDQLLRPEGVTAHYQPIVTLSDGVPMGYEAFARSNVQGMELPAAMFSTATALDRAVELSVCCREKATLNFARFPGMARLFLNTDPAERFDKHFVKSLTRLREMSPDLPLTLEIHKECVTSTREIADLAVELKRLNIQFAYDAFGAGQSVLAELVAVPPDYVKLDRALIANIDHPTNPMKPMIRGFVETIQAVGSLSVAQGIETAEQADACRELGIDLGQGFYFGRPFPI